MSQQACADFLAAVSSDATLQQEVATALSQANLEALYGYKEDWEIYSMEGRGLTELEQLRRLEAEGNAWVRKRLGAGGSKTWVRVYITRSRQEASRNYPRTYSGYCSETEAVDIAILFDS